MSTEVSKTEYLKRYLENKKDKKRKLKKQSTQSNPHMPRLKILNENIDIKSMKLGDKSEDDEDEAPVVAEVIDERPVEIKLKELYESSRWKKLGENEGLHSDSLTNCKSKGGDSDISPALYGKEPVSCKRSTTKNAVLLHEKTQSVKKERRRHDSDSDLSPPRQNETLISANKQRDLDSDLSPPRHNKIQQSSNKRHDSDSDFSPPWHSKSQRLRNKSHDSDSDPPRRNETETSSNNRLDFTGDNQSSKDKLNAKSQSRHNAGHGCNSSKILIDKNVQILSEKTHGKKYRYDKDSDLSPPRRNRSKTPVKIVEKSNISSNKCSSDSDLSPPRSAASSIKNSKSENNRPVKTLSGLSAGLQNAAVLKRETQDLRQRERKHINELNDELSGRNADTIIRDRKTGLKRHLEVEQMVEEAKQKKTAEYKQKYAEWGRGIEQTENRLNKLSDDMYEISKPLARYCDDEDLEERLKSVIHDDDPMAEYIKKKRKQKAPSGPVYSGPPAPPNRFGILPGFRWDGVDRSNGFEKRYFEKHNTSKAAEEEAYLWSVQNM